MKKLGQSGVELHEVKRHVTLDDETILPSRPTNPYEPKKGRGGKSISHPLGLFPGIGEYIPSHKRKLPELLPIEAIKLIVIYDNKGGTLKADDPVCKRLLKKNVIFWSANRWVTTWKGDALVKGIDRTKKMSLEEMKGIIKERKRKLKNDLK